MARLTDPAVMKLALKLADGELAGKLVRAGFTNPAKIRAATDRELKAISGVGQATVDRIRETFPRHR